MGTVLWRVQVVLWQLVWVLLNIVMSMPLSFTGELQASHSPRTYLAGGGILVLSMMLRSAFFFLDCDSGSAREGQDKRETTGRTCFKYL